LIAHGVVLVETFRPVDLQSAAADLPLGYAGTPITYLSIHDFINVAMQLRTAPEVYACLDARRELPESALRRVVDEQVLLEYFLLYGTFRSCRGHESAAQTLENHGDELDELPDRIVDNRQGSACLEYVTDALTDVRGLAPNTAIRHFHVMHHMMEKASTIWSKVTGIDRNPADQVEVEQVDDSRERCLSEEEHLRLKVALDERMHQKGTKTVNKTNLRLRLLVLIAVRTGMRRGEIFRLQWSDVRCSEGLIAVNAKLKKGRLRYVPMTPELAEEIRRYPAVRGEDRILPPEAGATSGRQRADKSFANPLKRAKIRNFRFHDLRQRPTFASWYMMCGGDLHELSKLLGHSNISMTERYAKLAQKHIMKTGSVSREIWSKLEPQKEARKEVQETKDGHISSPGCVRIVSPT
jgi:site-specific recombinase XerD